MTSILFDKILIVTPRLQDQRIPVDSGPSELTSHVSVGGRRKPRGRKVVFWVIGEVDGIRPVGVHHVDVRVAIVV